MKSSRRDFLKAVAVLGAVSSQLIKAEKSQARLGRNGQPKMAGKGDTTNK